MEQFLLANLDRYQTLVQRFSPPKPADRPKAKESLASAPNMLVTTRLRPLLGDERDVGWPPSVFPRSREPNVLDIHELRHMVRGPPVLRSFNYEVDRIYNAEATTEQIYTEAVKPLVPWAWNGGIGTLFAYGQTGSGKTHTVTRLERHVAVEMFGGGLDGHRDVYLTVIELAGNTARDLLNNCGPVTLLEDSLGVTQLTGAVEHRITSTDEMLNLIDVATGFRRTESTEKNDGSSRSHSICRIRVEDPADRKTADGLLYLVDLAGSEAARDSANHSAQRMQETREINTSLSVLKECMRGKAEADALAGTPAGKKKKVHLPFRQSALTKVLKHVFDPANHRPCKTAVIACVNPCLADVGSTKNTLRYAETLRVLVPSAKPLRSEPNMPMTWSNQQVKDWIKNNSGTPPVDATILAPTETGAQVLRLAGPEFEARCLKSPGVSQEQAKAFRSKLWQLHIDSKHAPSSNEGSNGVSSRESNSEPRASSQDPNASNLSLPFKYRIRPGMVVSWNPRSALSAISSEMNMAVVLCPAESVEKTVQDASGQLVTAPQGDDASAESVESQYLCATVAPAVMSGAYEVQLWRQVMVSLEQMEAEVLLEYDAATRYYYIAI